MQKRSPSASIEQILQWFYENRTGVHAHEAYKITPGYRLAPSILDKLVEQGLLIAVWVREEDQWEDPWNFMYRLSYEEWLKRASRDELGDTL